MDPPGNKELFITGVTFKEDVKQEAECVCE